MKKLCGIYKITSPNGKIYIGQSIDINHRFKQYERGYHKSQRKLIRSINKYGWSNHSKDILHQCSRTELNALEMYYSELYDSTNPSRGLNIRQCGGSTGRLSEETKKRIGAANRGRGVTKETREKIRNTLMGNIPWNKGKSGLQTAWNKGIPRSQETKAKLRACSLGKIGDSAPHAKRIFQYDVNDNVVKVWPGAREVTRKLGYSWSTINRAARGERITAYGFKWKYAA